VDKKEHGKRRNRDAAGRETSPCIQCGADTHDDIVKAAFWGERGVMVIEGIAAQVCECCGEQFYDEGDARKIKQMIAHPPADPKEELLVPVFSLREFGASKKGSDPAERIDEQVHVTDSMRTRDEKDIEAREDDRADAEACLCRCCGCQTYRDTVHSVLWADRGLVAIEDIPARVCRKCKEQYYDEETAWRIAKLREPGFPAEMAKRKLRVPVFSLSEAQVA
jgi:YgiT-type zinc finger domain-containing protein